MAGFVKSLANTIRIDIDWTGPDGASATNVLYAELVTPATIDATILFDCAQQMGDAVTGTSSNGPVHMASNLWTCHQIRTFDNSGTTELFNYQVVDHVGAGVSPSLPPQVAVCSGWQIAAHYRGGHPRTYWPGIQTASLDNPGGRYLSAAALAGWTTAANALLTEFETAGPHAGMFYLGCVSASRSGVQLVPPVFYRYRGATVHSRLDSQRRRSGKET